MILLAICPTYSQITKFKHSTTISYDSGVAMPLNTYRAIRSKSILMDSLVENLQSEIELKDTIISNYSNTIFLQNEKNKSYQNSIDILEKKNKRIFFRKETYIALFFGVIIGIILK